jgi:23S rRNA (cytosine1962-C5)-methyltransferase
MIPAVFLKKGRERSVLLGHPWVFGNSIETVKGAGLPGEVVRAVSASGQFLAWGYYNPASQIALRLLSWDESATINEGWWRTCIAESVKRRGEYYGKGPCRLVFGESDGIPGCIADRYGDYIVLQALTAGTERVKGILAAALMELPEIKGVYERSDSDLRRLEGLETACGTLCGMEPPETIEVRIDGLRFLTGVSGGQKTGFYLDQRENRKRVAAYAGGRRVLDCFSYTGAFAVYSAASGAAEIIRVDSSEPALELGGANLRINGYSEGNAIKNDVFKVLRTFCDKGERFDLIILDPPKFAPTRRHAEKAARSYKDCNLFALKLLKTGGILATFSCSGGIERSFFQKIVFQASVDAAREIQVIEQLSQSPDHPIRLSFPESEYLKGMICRVV